MPRIGLSTYVEPARWGVWEERAALLPADYIEMVASAVGVPALLPPIAPRDLADAAAVAVAGVHGLVLTGGADIDPGHYGAVSHPETDAPRTDRDAWELALLRAALEADAPVLAVCRGAQLLNVARGGTLHQHLPDVVGEDTHRPVLGSYARVPVQVEHGSRLAAIVGEAPEVSCHHHQAIDRLGEDVAACAHAGDGTVEGVELTGFRFVVGVQWHPEADGDGRLFAALVEAAARTCT
jgi:putative glutamine amidotransferase